MTTGSQSYFHYLKRRQISVNLFVSLVAAHLADGVLEHNILLEEVVHRHFVLSVVVHRALEEEAEEALYAEAACTLGEVAQKHEVKAERSCKDRVAAEEVDLYLHGIAHPAENVDVVPALLVVVARGIVVDAHLVIILGVFIIAVAIEAGLGMFVKTEKPEFIGREAVIRQKTDGVSRKIVGLEIEGPAIARHGYDVLDCDGNKVGEVTTGYRSITLGRNLAMAIVEADCAKLGTKLQVQVRRKIFPAQVIKKRFYTPNYKK